MTWRPIAQSGVPFTFAGGAAELSGSTVVAPFSVTPDWEIELAGGAEDYAIRVTVQAYQSTMQFEEEPSTFTFTTAGDVETVVTNGNEGTTSAFSPNPVLGSGCRVVYTPGVGTETSRSESYTMLVEVEGPDTCQEIGRVTRAYVSAHDRTRVHVSRLRRGEKRCLVANFNGALPATATIARAEWRLAGGGTVAISDGEIVGREARVTVQARYSGATAVRCEVTLANGEIYNQVFEVDVADGPSFGDTPPAAGASVIIVTA